MSLESFGCVKYFSLKLVEERIRFQLSISFPFYQRTKKGKQMIKGFIIKVVDRKRFPLVTPTKLKRQETRFIATYVYLNIFKL